MKNASKKAKIVYRIFITLGIIGFLDLLSKPLVTPIVEKTFGDGLNTQVSFLTLLYFDMANAGLGFVAEFYLQIVILLNGFLWIVFLIGAYAIRRNYMKEKKKTPEILNDASNGSYKNTSETKSVKINQNNKLAIVGGIIAIGFGLLFLFRIFTGTSIPIFAFLIGGLFTVGGFMLLRESFKKR